MSSLGQRAFQRTKTILALGPRPPGSKALDKARQQLAAEMTSLGLIVKWDRFKAQTPIGAVNMANLIGVVEGQSNRILMVGCHLDTKVLPFRFVGANDATSACALLMEIIPLLNKKRPKKTMWFIFFDGEESYKKWSPKDSLYGSRHLAGTLKASNLVQSIDAFILLDMVGDRHLDIAHENHADPRLIGAVKRLAKKQGVEKHFFQYKADIDDDHMPFFRLGISTLNLIDFHYGKSTSKAFGAGSFFHTKDDTIDKISAKSLQIVGNVVVELIEEVNAKWPDL